MAMVELAPRDLMIAEVLDKETNLKKEVVRIKGACAFDEDFIEECKLKGVKKWEDREVPNL